MAEKTEKSIGIQADIINDVLKSANKAFNARVVAGGPPTVITRNELIETLKAWQYPKKGEDWMAALTNPNSPIYKLLMKILKDVADFKSVIEELVKEWKQIADSEERKKQEEINSNQRAAALAEAKFQELDDMIKDKIKDEIRELELKQLKALSANLPLFIKILESKTDKLNHNVAKIKEKIPEVKKAVSKELEKIQAQKEQKLLDAIAPAPEPGKELPKPVPVFELVTDVATGKETPMQLPSFEAKQKLQAAPKLHTFAELLEKSQESQFERKVYELWREDNEEKKDNKEKKPNVVIKRVVRFGNVMDAINKIGNLGGGDVTPTRMMHLVNANPDLNTLMGKVGDEKSADGKRTFNERNEEEIEKLFKVRDELAKAEDAVNRNKSEISSMRQLLDTTNEQINTLDKQHQPGMSKG